MTAEHKCCAMVYERTGWGRSYPCGKRAKIERDGKRYCGTHDPQKDADRRAASAAKHERARKIENARIDLSMARTTVVEAAMAHARNAEIADPSIVAAVAALDAAHDAYAMAGSVQP